MKEMDQMDLDTLLHDTAPVPAPSTEVLAAGRGVLDAAIPASIALANRRRQMRRRAAVAALAAAAAVVLVALPTISFHHAAPGGSASAAGVLRLAAQAAGEQPGGWPDADYWHSVSHYSRGGSAPVLREVWWGHTHGGALVDPGVTDGVIPLPPAQFVGGTYIDWDGLYALPTDPAQLEAVLGQGRTPNDPKRADHLLNTVAGLLRESPASPALRRALFQVIANTAGIEYSGRATDADGRTGAVVTGGDMELIIDTSDGQLLQLTEGNLITTYEAQGPASIAPAPTAKGY
jgi:hypothetical protein